ncbi:hypothetical protein HaLaN_01578 [Haematococcus lacustris]|uniref:Uncharacterized protein n=1 Tax=Haematococcus lacustris TaxID=44745 RepID=A0A699YG72_HAELA|nr:hypothetical protein HaLaN_01578 [Haematococcus lacustris]
MVKQVSRQAWRQGGQEGCWPACKLGEPLFMGMCKETLDPVYRDVTILDPFDPEQLAQLQATAPDVACAASRALALPDSLLLALAHAAPEDQPQLPSALPDAQACPAWSLRPPLHTVAPHGAPGLAPGCAVAAGSHQRLPKLEDAQHSVQNPLKGLGHVRDLVEGGSKAATKSTDTPRAGALCRGARGSEGASDVPLLSQEAEQEVAMPGADRAAAGKEITTHTSPHTACKHDNSHCSSALMMQCVEKGKFDEERREHDAQKWPELVHKFPKHTQAGGLAEA